MLVWFQLTTVHTHAHVAMSWGKIQSRYFNLNLFIESHPTSHWLSDHVKLLRLRYFESFIRERSMYYVCSNIVKPLTQPYQLSFAELIGPREIQWFVSHYWGMSVRHLSDAICKHAEGCDGDWRDSAYWICTFSNNQWLVKNELGDGRWQESSFYLALTSPQCKGTAMIIDESVSPLQRVWCLFEVYQTICLSRSEHFQGLLLCASTGVLQQGKAGTDVAVAVATKVAELDTRGAQASDETDRQMIHSLIEQMPGGFDTMNRFVRDTICNALWASHVHYEGIFKSLMYDLTSEVSATLPAPLPTILTSTPQQSRTVDNKQWTTCWNNLSQTHRKPKRTKFEPSNL